ncbi:hypothetical protein ACLM5J_08525 [Nocardioides sp. Bht2]|uniref:hypothetical protein n=1 Tax=Nocardioides sp. Bht2 TaxID=3392297 RepID=UPI0039B64D2A
MTAALLLPAALLLGCGGEDGGGQKAESSPKATMAAYFDALADADYALACKQLTDEYRAGTIEEWNSLMDEKTTTCEETLAASVDMVKAFSDAEDGKALWRYEGLNAVVDGDSAMATVQLTAFQDEDSTYFLQKVDGAWLVSGDDDGSESAE